jgi:hypothetical protein
MASNSETGHATNVANYKTLLTICLEMGGTYQPTAEVLQIANLQKKSGEIDAPMKLLKDAMPLYTTAVADKDAAFKPLNKWITRVINGFATCGAKEGEVNNATTIAKKITGATKPAEKKAKKNEEADYISQSQASMDMRIENLNKLIAILAANKNYKPNEADLQVAALEAYAALLQTHVDKVKTAGRPVKLAREKRDIVLYTNETGIVDTALLAKKYTLSALGSDSALYKIIKGLKFRNR